MYGREDLSRTTNRGGREICEGTRTNDRRGADAGRTTLSFFEFSRGVGSSVGAAACSRWVCCLSIIIIIIQ